MLDHTSPAFVAAGEPFGRPVEILGLVLQAPDQQTLIPHHQVVALQVGADHPGAL
ncbi:MAG: hypothetical protein WA990_07135 [Rubrobacteraceae bacterium]